MSGVFRVEVGKGLLARILRLFLRIRLKDGEFPVRLAIVPRGDGEVWERVMGSWHLATCLRDHHGLLRERCGLLLFDLRLDVNNGGLSYTQTALRLDVGLFRIPIPSFMAVRISALEECGPQPLLTKLAVRVDSPIMGLLVAYSGTLGAA